MLICGSYDLPPTQKALPLPVGKPSQKETKNGKKSAHSKEVVDGYGKDDTPRAFSRLLTFQKSGKTLRKGLDNGGSKPQGKKRKRDDDTQNSTASKEEKITEKPPIPEQSSLRIQPGEKLTDFAIRVDQAMPISGISTKGKKVEGAPDHRQSKHERKLRRMQTMWREEEAKIREREEEEREQAEDEWEEKLAGMNKDTREVMTSLKHGGGIRKKKRKGRERMVGEVGDDDDPWAVLKTKRDEPKGLFDVAKAPPKFDKLPKEKLKQRAQVDDVPRAAGSLRRREDLRETRDTIIKNYRSLMATKNG
jgi:hypothetical protein